MLKKTTSVLLLCALVAVPVMRVPVVAQASDYNRAVTEVMSGTFMDEAVLISETDNIANGRLTTTKTYRLPDGGTVIDTFERSAFQTFSEEGTDDASRSRTSRDLYGVKVKVTLKAEFEWYRDTNGQRCVDVTAKSAFSDYQSSGEIVRDEWEVGEEGKVYAGATEAWVDYRFYNMYAPMTTDEYKLKIYCNDSGNISDNAN